MTRGSFFLASLVLLTALRTVVIFRKLVELENVVMGKLALPSKASNWRN